VIGQTAAHVEVVQTADPAPAGSAVPASRDEEAIRGLAIAARTGDEAAFVSLYRTYAPAVYRFCLARVGRPEDAEDLLQQTFLRVVEALPRYEDRGIPFGAWLFRIARSVTVDQHRRRRDDLSLDIEGAETTGGPAAPSTIDLGEREVLLAALASLTPDQREVVRLRFFADLTARESGLILGRDEVAVRALQWRALAALRRALDPPLATPPARRVPRLVAT
jgi:RNA polymerase sigma-70 factor, ECF subfamily